MRLFPLFNSILRTALDADGKKIVNLGTPTQDADAANKKYVDEHGGGVSVTIDDTVTRTSANPVKSSGIWSAIWGTLTALPTGFSSLYDWCAAKFAALQDGKRDKTDLKAYGTSGNFGILRFVGSGIHSEDGTYEWNAERNRWEFFYEEDKLNYIVVSLTNGIYSAKMYWYAMDGEEGDLEGEWTGTEIGDQIQIDNEYGDKSVFNVARDNLATESGVAAAIEGHHDSTKQDKITASGILKGDGHGVVSAATKSSTAQDPANADYRDPQDNTCHKTEDAYDGEPVECSPKNTEFNHNAYGRIETYDDEYVIWTVITDEGTYDTVITDKSTTSVTIGPFTLTRRPASTLNETYTTKGYVDGKVSAAVSTNNPEFVSAVRNTPAPEPGQGESPPWGTWGTVGAAIAGLVSGLAWLKNKIFDNDGNIQDQFATDLLGKQVAKNALMIPLEAKTDSFAAEDGHAYAVTMTGTVTITMPTTTAGKAAIFQARFSAAAQQSVEFSTAALVKFDGTDCGIVKAGKDALLSAMWNGEAWDLVWKNQA